MDPGVTTGGGGAAVLVGAKDTNINQYVNNKKSEFLMDH